MIVQIVLFDGFDPLDVIAPFEVFAAGGDVVGDEPQIAFVCAEGPRTIVSGTYGFALAATSVLDPEAGGIVLVPGASGSVHGDPDRDDATVAARLSHAARSALTPLLARALDHPHVTVATVCGGSLILGMAGLIGGRPATGHSLGLGLLEHAGVEVVRARVVDDGDLVTAGGVTSGLDLALHLLERFSGPRVAHAVESLFEYERRGTVWSAAGRSNLSA